MTPTSVTIFTTVIKQTQGVFFLFLLAFPRSTSEASGDTA